MKLFASLAVALVAAVALTPAAAMDAKAIAPRRQPEPLTAVEAIAASVRHLEEVLPASDNSDVAASEETGAEGDNEEVLALEATEVPTVDADADAESKPQEEEVAPLIDPVSFTADSTSGSADAGEDNRRRNLRSL